MVANLVRTYDRDNSFRLVRSSFAQFLSEEPLTRQLNAVLAVLEQRHYMQGWSLTPDGERLVGIYHDCDLLIAEAMKTGLFDGLGVADLTALVSLFTYESRRETGVLEMPNATLSDRLEALDILGARLRSEEQALRLPQTRSLDTGFAAISAAWVKGSDLSEILLPPRRHRQSNDQSAPLMTGGDFVRNIKQLVDLLRQISLSPGPASFKAVAAGAAEQLVRGIVAASTGVGFADIDEVEDDPR
jgi:ATP-dependent RNA helicase HelY